MIFAHRSEGVVVADGALPPGELESLRRDVANADFRRVHSQRWDTAWKLWDGDPLRGPAVYFDPGNAFGWSGASYPTATSVDRLVEAVREVATAHPDLAGVEGVDWVALFLAPWLYPVGSALSLHADSGRYSGSFTFFAHPRWRVAWGGDLMVYPKGQGCSAPSWMSDDDGGELASPPSGVATCILPRPNRLVVLGPDHPHRISRVDWTAGTNVRVSLAGFFLRPPNAGRM